MFLQVDLRANRLLHHMQQLLCYVQQKERTAVVLSLQCPVQHYPQREKAHQINLLEHRR